jgi:hypothetical protein
MNMKSKKEIKFRSIPIQQDPMVVQYLAADISIPPPPPPRYVCPLENIRLLD